MHRLRPRLLGGLWVAMFAASTALIPAAAAASSSSIGFTSRVIHKGGTGSPATGQFIPSGINDVGTREFAGEAEDSEGDGSDEFEGNAVNISMSNGHAMGQNVPSQARARSNPHFVNGFEGLNLYQQRYAAGGNQFSVEPPDQALCVGNGYVVEAVNDVLNVFDYSGDSQLPDNTATNIVAGHPRNVHNAVDLNSFYGYDLAFNRSNGMQGPFVTDPSCLYDKATNRFFVAVLTLDVIPETGDFTGGNHIDIAVSKTGDPTGDWNIYQMDVTWDGTDLTSDNSAPGPFLGDYPHIGADANGFYVTTNAYPWCCNAFAGAQVYAMSKKALAHGDSTIDVAWFNTATAVNVPSADSDTQPGFTLWPAQSPGAKSFDKSHGGTEYFMSSNAADEATHPTGGSGNYESDQIIVWTMTNTASLNSDTPSPALSNYVLDANPYAIPPKQQQPGSGDPPDTTVPMGYCLNDTTVDCWQLFTGGPAGEVVSRPDANDTRMQQVMYANSQLYGALDTAVMVGGENRAGIAWYIVNPKSQKMSNQGYLGAANHDFTYPAIGVTAGGRGIMAFTATGDNLNPSAGYAPIGITGVGKWNVVPGGEGQAADDGFTSYKTFVGNPPRTRWGDYSAAAVAGNSVWIASEYIASACDFNDWVFGPDNLLGTCGYDQGGGVWTGTRAAFGNWSTYVSHFRP